MLQTNLNKRVVTACFALSLGWAFNFGVSEFSLFCSPALQIQRYSDASFYELEDRLGARCDHLNVLYGFGILLGFIMSWPLANKFGRKGAIIFAILIRFFVVLLDIAEHYLLKNNEIILIVSGGLQGIYNGLLEVLPLLYIYEVSPTLKSTTASLSALPVIALFMLFKESISYLSLAFSLAIIPVAAWFNNSIGGLSLISCISQFAILLMMCPESPGFLAVKRGELEKAKIGN